MNTDDYIRSARAVIDIEIEALQQGRDAIGEEFAQAIQLLHGAAEQGRVVVMGMGKSGHIGKKIAATLASTGTPAIFVHPAEAGHGDLGMITSRDVVLAISQSGKSDELLRITPYLKRNGIKLIVLSGDSVSPLAKHANIVIDTAVPKEACPLGLAPTASTTLSLALGDALAICLLQVTNFTKEDFASTHPHGALGRKLLVSVSDVMSGVGIAPLIQNDITIKDALHVMSKGGMGFVVIINDRKKPVGVFTDGDLRRTLDRDVDIKQMQIKEVMTKDFVSINKDQLAVTAVELMERQKVSALPVVDEAGFIAGALNMRQLLQAGVV